MNTRYGAREENLLNAVRAGRRVKQRGETMPLSVEAAVLYDCFIRVLALAGMYNKATLNEVITLLKTRKIGADEPEELAMISAFKTLLETHIKESTRK